MLEESAPLNRREWVALLLLAACLAVLPYLTEPTIFTSLDWQRIHQFYKEYLVHAVWRGRLPLWNPHVSLGRPFLADVDAVLFYPPSLVFLLAPVVLALPLWIFFHMTLGLYGTVRLALHLGILRTVAFACATAFMLAGPMTSAYAAGLIHYGAAMAYLPLVLWLGLRMAEAPTGKRWALLSMALGLQLLCGHPQVSWLTGLGLGLLLLGRPCKGWSDRLRQIARDEGALLLAVVAAGLLNAIVLLPLAELAGQSNRVAATVEFAASYAMSGAGWMTMLAPMEPTFPLPPHQLLYAGVAVTLLAPLTAGIMHRGLLLMAGVAALLALGLRTPFFQWLYWIVPGVSMFRIPSRAGVLIVLAMVMGAGLALSRTTDRRVTIGVSVVGVLYLGLFTILALRPISALPHLSLASLGLQVLLITLSGAAVVMHVWARRQQRPRLIQISLLMLGGLTLFDLSRSTWAIKPVGQQPGNVRNAPRLEAQLRTSGLMAEGLPPPRLLAPAHVLENAGMRHGWSTPAGYASMTLGRVWNHLHEVAGAPIPDQQVTYPEDHVLWAGAPRYDSMNLVLVQDPMRRELHLRKDPDPRVYVTGAIDTVPDQHVANARMREGYPFHTIALVESSMDLPPTSPPHFTASATIVSFAPESIRARVQSSHPGLLVLAEPYYPGWRARWDGQDVACVPVNGWMRGVAIPAGEHVIEFQFHSTYLGWGAMLSAFTLAGLVFLLARRRRV